MKQCKVCGRVAVDVKRREFAEIDLCEVCLAVWSASPERNRWLSFGDVEGRPEARAAVMDFVTSQQAMARAKREADAKAAAALAVKS